MFGAWRLVGQCQKRIEASVVKESSVRCGVPATVHVPRGQVRKLHAKDCGLQRVHPEVAAYGRVVILGLLAVGPEESHPPRHLVVICRHQPRVPESSEVLAREEGKASHRAERACVTSFERGANGLRSVFDDRNPRGQRLGQGFDVGAEPEEVHGNHCLRTRGDSPHNGIGLQQKRPRIDVDKDRPRTEARHAARGSKERKRWRDDLVPRSDAERHQGHEQRIGPRRHRNGMAHSDRGCQFRLESADFGAEDEVLRRADALDRTRDLVANRRILKMKVEKGDSHALLRLGFTPGVSRLRTS